MNIQNKTFESTRCKNITIVRSPDNVAIDRFNKIQVSILEKKVHQCTAHIIFYEKSRNITQIKL